MLQDCLIGIIAATATAGVLTRPARLPEAVFSTAGAGMLLGCGLIPWRQAMQGVLRGTDVYLFLAGMMLLSEIARAEGLFDHLAAHAVARAEHSAARLFTLIYAAGVAVTMFLSNDATAVVLTPAVAAATRAAGMKNPLPCLLVCAFVANAASFALPISNPANLVLYQSHLPALPLWLRRFALPSLAAIAATYVLLRFTQAKALRERFEGGAEIPALSANGKAALAGLAATALLLLGCSALGVKLGAPTALAAALTLGFVCIRARQNPWPRVKHMAWDVLVLVAGLFVLVAALRNTGLPAWLGHMQGEAGAAASAVALAVACNLANNLPAGLLAAEALQHATPQGVDAALIGVDLGPNLSITGSLATILWLAALRREGITCSGWQFFKLGICVMPPALALALAARFI